jgi:hypothetical protein
MYTMSAPSLLPSAHYSTIGLVVKFNVAIVEPRVRFPDGANNTFAFHV